jgi:hypothetical protein
MIKKPLIDYFLKKLSHKQSIFITIRNKQLRENLSNGKLYIKILPFSLSETNILLRLKAGTIAVGWNDANCNILRNILGCIPLAISQAAAFVRRNKISLQKYLEIFERNEQNFKIFINIEF